MSKWGKESESESMGVEITTCSRVRLLKLIMKRQSLKDEWVVSECGKRSG